MAERDLVIGLDCSTTAAKAVVWDSNGNALSMARAEFELAQPRPTYAEQNAEDWWTAAAAAVRRAVQSVPTDRIAALCITHQRETFACLDKAGRPLRPAMVWADSRASAQVEKYGSAEVHRITGKPPNTTPAWYKLLWMAEHEPETLQRTAKFVDVHGFLVHRITGEWRTSWASADPLGLVDLTTLDYDDGLLSAAGIRREQLCDLVAPGSVIGTVGEVAAELGVVKGLPVIAGLGDGQAAQLGCGITAPGTAFLNIGTGTVSGTFSEKYSYSREFRTMTAGIPGGYSLETFIGGGTYNIKWFVDRFAGVDTRALGLELSPEQVLEAAAAVLPPGAHGLLALPYWTGALTPYWDHNAKGALLGLTGMHGKGHVYRALLESIAFEQRMLTAGAEAATGAPISRMIALGGGARSRVWCQIIADVLRREVQVVREYESTCLGAGVLAAAAVGLHPSVQQAAAAMSGTGMSFQPDPANIGIYDELFNVYRDIYPSLRNLFARLAAVTS